MPPTKIWSGSLQFGMDGVEGNSQSMNLRFGFDARRKTDLHLLYMNADYTPDHVELQHDDQSIIFPGPLRADHSRYGLDALRRGDGRIRPFSAVRFPRYRLCRCGLLVVQKLLKPR